MNEEAIKISGMIEQMKAYYVAHSFTLVLVNDPDVIALVESRGFDRE